MTMNNKCEPCAANGLSVRATGFYISFSGQKTFACGPCRIEGEAFAAHMRGTPVASSCIEQKTASNYRASGTSQQAAQSASLRSEKTCLQILAQLRLDPLTPDEIADTCGLVLNTVRSRITDMKEFCYVKPNGSQRQTHAGGRADVIEITAIGRAFLDKSREGRAA